MTISKTSKTSTISTQVEGTVVTFTVALPGGAKTLRLDVAQLGDDIRLQACLHGLKQKVVDAAAIPRCTETGRSASVAEKFAAMEEVVARLTDKSSPSWNKTARGEAVTATGGLLAEALMTLTGKSRDAIVTFLSDKDKKQRAALRDDPRISVLIARLKAERAGPAAGGLLDGLMGEGEDEDAGEDAPL